MQQRALTRGANTGNFLQSGFSDVPSTQLTMRSDDKPMRLITQSLDKIQNRIQRFELDGWTIRQEQGFAAGITVRSLGNRHQRDPAQTQRLKYPAGGIELAEAAVDD